MTIPIIDAHLDLSWCALSWDRDLTEDVETIRRREAGMRDHRARGAATVSLDALRRGDVGLCFGTVLARAAPVGYARDDLRNPRIVPPFQESKAEDGPRRYDLDRGTHAIAYAIACGQLAYYHELERSGEIRMIATRGELDAHWRQWRSVTDKTREPVGVLLAMEGADPIVAPERAAEWWEKGLRSLGPVHYGTSAYAVGTGEDGSLSADGLALLKQMERLGLILDVTHMSDTSLEEALDAFGGPVIASHHNCRALVPGDRQLTDQQIRRLIARGAVIGSALDAWMLEPNWRYSDPNNRVSLAHVADQIEHVCVLAGNADHAAFGSDLDGGFGSEQAPQDLDTITDLQKLAEILRGRGFDEEALHKVFHGNWLRLLRAALPA